MKNLVIALLGLFCCINSHAQTALDAQEVRHTSFVAMIDDNADLRLQVATDASFNNLVVDKLATWGFNPLHVNSDLRIKNLTQNTTYYYRFSYDNEPYSYGNIKSVTTWDPPTVATALQPDIAGYDDITLNWTNDDPDAVFYEIYVYADATPCSGGDVYTQYDIISTSSTSINYNALDFDVASWQFRIYAQNSSGEFGNFETLNVRGCACYSAIDFSTFFDDKEIVVGGTYQVKYTDGTSLNGTDEGRLNYVWTYPSAWEMTNYGNFFADIETGVGDGQVTVTVVNPCTFTGEESATLSIPVTGIRLDQTISFDPLALKKFGDPDITLMATASSGLAVNYSSSNTSVATVSGSAVSIVGVGESTITASQAGDGVYNAAPNVWQALTVDKGDQVITFNALPDKIFGDVNFDLPATASSGLPVIYSSSTPSVATVSGNTVTVVGVGTTTISAAQPGNSNYNFASGVIQELTINQASQTITFANLPSRRILDADFDLSATASSGLPVSYSSSDMGVATVSGTTVSIIGVGNTTITASQGGDGDYEAASDVLKTLLVNKESQTITFPTFVNTSFGDAPVDLTASASSGLPVTYVSDDESVVTISGNTVTIVGVGSTTITVSQAGDDIYNAASDVSRPITVTKANQSITFGSLASKTFGDGPFSLSGSASSGLAVNYSSSNTDVATISGNTVTIVGAGSTTITASQGGDGDYEAASDVDQILTVNQASQSITFGSLTSKTFGDVNFNLTATASSGLTTSYESSDLSVATVSGNSVTIVGAGTTTITASQSGDTDYSAASDVPQSLTVNQASQSITFGALAAKTFGDADFALGATSSSGLTMSYSSSDLSVATISGSTVTIVGVGTTTITASQSGNVNFNAASDETQDLVVNRADQTINFNSLSNSTFGDASFELTAGATSGLSVSYASSNEVVATISGSTVTIVGAGTTTFTASQSGNTNYNVASDVQQNLTVEKADQMITFGALASKELGGLDFALTATSSSSLSIAYESSNTAVAIVSGTTVTIVGAGTTSITASQAGNSNFNPASDVSQSLIVTDPAKLDQSITFTTLNNKFLDDPDFTLSATASSGLTVSYSSSNTGVATVTGNLVTIVGTGTTTLTASQGGNDTHNPAPSVEQSFVVLSPSKQDQVITFSALPSKTYGDDPVNLSATASSGLTTTYSSSDASVASISGATISIVGAGTSTITASQLGDNDYNAAPDAEQTLTVLKANQTITIEAIEDGVTTDTPIDVVAEIDSELLLTFAVSGPATITGQTITLDGSVGTVEVVVSQAGNNNYNAAEESESFEVFEGVLGTEEPTQVKLYPNPATDFMMVQSGVPVDIRIFSVSGNLIFGQKKVTDRIDISAINEGMYLIEISLGEAVSTTRFYKTN